MREHLEKDYRDASVDTISDDFLEGTLDLQKTLKQDNYYGTNKTEETVACQKVGTIFENLFLSYKPYKVVYSKNFELFNILCRDLVGDYRGFYLSLNTYNRFLDNRSFADLSVYENSQLKKAFEQWI